MAKILDKDEVTYSKERDSFLRDLQHFHETRGTPFRRNPSIGNKEIDLYLLYSLVTAQGGWMKVNTRNTWNGILQTLRLPGHCVNGSVALKQIYLRYLDRWEKVHFLGEDADRASDDDEENRHKRWSARALHAVPYTYNYSQHNVADVHREYNHLSNDLYKPSDYDRLALSLISSLPNEQDFAINVCTLLSNDSKRTLKLEKHPRIINYLLAHAGVYNHVSLRRLFTHHYREIRKKPFQSFWSDVLESNEFLDLTNENKFVRAQENNENPPFSDTLLRDDVLHIPDEATDPSTEEIAKEDDDTECEIVDTDTQTQFKLKLDSADSEFFCVNRTLGTQDYIGQRVLQIATILRNLCYIEDNVPILVNNETFLRFMLLCACARWNVLRNLGLDMLGNISLEYIMKDVQGDIIAGTILKIVTNNLNSVDRTACLSSVEVLNKLSQNELNEDVLLRSLESSVYRKVCSFLTIHDVMLLIYTLECLYSLSSLGERSCTYIANIHGVIDTLVSLVTVEGKSYGPKACIGMKLVETIPSGSQQQQTQSQSSANSVSTATSTTTSSSSSTSTLTTLVASVNTATSNTAATNSETRTVNTTSISTNSPTSVTPVKATPASTPARNVTIAPQRLLSTPTVTTTVSTTTTTSTPVPYVPTPHQTGAQIIQSLTPQQLIQQQHAHQQTVQENEQFALAWLRATYEPVPCGKIDHQEVYKNYINSCSKIGRKGVISPLHFPRCVRSVFGGTVGPNPVKPSNPNDPQFYEGIKVRTQPLHINIPTQPPQPISSSYMKSGGSRRKSSTTNLSRTKSPPVVQEEPTNYPAGSSPASPILKAQLSAPPKQRDNATQSNANLADAKSQIMAHPHLSQALLGTPSANSSLNSTSSTSTLTIGSSSKDITLTQLQQATSSGASSSNNSTSLIKSLLATKVNDCMSTVSMKTAIDCQSVAQVAARQQRLLAQQTTPNNTITSEQTPHKNQSKLDSLRMQRINGARQLFADPEINDPSVSSTTQFTTNAKGKKEPPQPPPPPLAPLSSSNNLAKSKTPPVINEDSDSIGNTSFSSTSGLGVIGIGCVSSTEDGDNSLTSFEGLLNGIPNADTSIHDDSSSSRDLIKNDITINKPLRLADLLEKKFEKNLPVLNGNLSKDRRLSVGLDLVENHIEKALNIKTEVIRMESQFYDEPIDMELESSIPAHVIKTEPLDIKMEEDSLDKPYLKRPAVEEIEFESKKPHMTTNVNGSASSMDSVSSSSNGDDGPATVSTAAAKLFADIAADILEDEDEEQLMQEVQATNIGTTLEGNNSAVLQQNNIPQIMIDGNQQMLLSQPRQIIVSQGQMQQANQSIVISAGTQLKTQSGQTVIVQNPSSQQRPPVLFQQSSGGQILLSQGIQGQMQLVAGSQPGQYVLQTSGATTQGYVVAQPQTAMVHGQPQTVLVAQAPQQPGSPAKTIIILQQQPSNSATHHQKVVVTPQGQQVVVTQVPRPVVHSSTVSNNLSQALKQIKTEPTSAAPTSLPPVAPLASSNGLSESKAEEPSKHPFQATAKTRIIRDLSSPFVCEWGDCNAEKFKSANQVYLHVCAEHCPTGNEEVLCEWERCDNLKRRRFSLMTHLHDKHCNTESMKQSLVRRKQIAQGAKVDPVPQVSTSPHPGYAPDAALHAIKRHALEFVNPKELQDDNEGPVTKSIRLTASLILRNLVIYSSYSKRYLKSYESHLANIALSNVESSRTIAQILYDINDCSTHR